jgi:hypothetical protein
VNDETPTHSYRRRNSEEMRPDELTNHRLTNLEEGVRQMTTQIASTHALVGEINTRLAVGGHLITGTEKRIDALERNQRFVVLGILSSLGLWVWEMIKNIASHARLPLLVVALLLPGCGKERAQVASDANAGVQAARQALVDNDAPVADAILDGVERRLPATAGVNSADWPVPAMTPAQIRSDPAKYGKSAPPEPDRVLFWSSVGAGALAAFAVARKLAPLVPGIGPVWSGVVDAAWSLAQHTQAKKADEANERAKQTIDTVRPTLALLRTHVPVLYNDLPTSARQAIDALIDGSTPPSAPA